MAARVGRITYIDHPPLRGLRPGKLVVLCTGQRGAEGHPKWQYAGAQVRCAPRDDGEYMALYGTMYCARVLTPWCKTAIEALNKLSEEVA